MKEFYERIWEKDPVARWSKKEINETMEMIRPFLKNDCLDVGCAYGLITNELNKIVPAQGIDISRTAVKKAKKNYPHVKFRQGSVTDIPFPGNSFSTIFAGEVIEHVPDTKKMFSEFRRVLKKNGNIIIIAPEFNFLKNLIVALFYWEKIYDPLGEHVRYYPKKTLKKILKKKRL
ncbi:MAG: class I SAM-dependent methyltransferase [Candidatus Diapherotrites archaeon]